MFGGEPYMNMRKFFIILLTMKKVSEAVTVVMSMFPVVVVVGYFIGCLRASSLLNIVSLLLDRKNLRVIVFPNLSEGTIQHTGKIL